MGHIPGGGKQDHPSVSGYLDQFGGHPAGHGRVTQFGAVPIGEILEEGTLVVIPLAELGTRCQLLGPEVEGGRRLADPTRPETVDEDPITRLGRLIDATNLEHLPSVGLRTAKKGRT